MAMAVADSAAVTLPRIGERRFALSVVMVPLRVVNAFAEAPSVTSAVAAAQSERVSAAVTWLCALT